MGANPKLPNPEKLARFRVMVAQHPEVAVKGAAHPYTAINGNMYSLINRDGTIGLRLSKQDKSEFEETYGPAPFEGYPGFVQKEYVALPEALVTDDIGLQDWFARSHGFASALKPKATTRRRKAKG